MTRTEEIIKLRQEKLTLKKIGEKFGISRQRVHRILERNGIKGRFYAERITTPCGICGEPIIHYLKIPRKFCSFKCRDDARRK